MKFAMADRPTRIMQTKLSISDDFGLTPIYHWKPVLGTKLLGFSIGRGLGALKGSRQPPHSEHISAKKRYTVISLS